MADDPHASATRTNVLIVGGGPVGLMLSILLSRQKVRHTLVEKHPSTTNHPKARNLNVRSMEIMRSLGLEERLREIALPSAWGSNITYVRTLAGDEIGHMATTSFEGDAATGLSPSAGLLSSQDVFEPIFRAEAEALGYGDLRFGSELVSLDADTPQDPKTSDPVRATIRRVDDGATELFDADYVIGCDGWKSAVRQHMGAEMEGRSGLGHFVNVHFRADFSRLVDHRPAVLFFVANDEVTGVFQPLDGKERWLCQISYDGRSDTLDSYDEERCLDWIARAIGETEEAIAPEILGVGSWTMNSTAASTYRSGRFLLAGDACHQLPPTGGFGMNTGIQDAHNLAWKLALVLRGHAGDRLLDTYEDERRPVAVWNAERSLDNSRMVGRINRAAADPTATDADVVEAIAASERYGNFTGMDLGFVYESAAVLPDGTDPPIVDDLVTDYIPSARPGHRAPYVAGPESIFDRLADHFVLVCSPGSDHLAQEFVASADELGLEGCEAVTIADATDPTETTISEMEMYGLQHGTAVLVRPDGHVGWRGAAGVGDALRRILHRSP